MEKLFDFFDAVYVLLSPGEDSAVSATGKRLQRLCIPYEALIENDYERSRADFEGGSSEVNRVALRHCFALKRMVRSNVQIALILEERVILRDDFSLKVEQLAKELKTIHWEVLHLGLRLTQSGGMCTDNIGYVREGSEFFAYAVTAKAARRIIANCERHWERDSSFSSSDFCDRHMLRLYSIPILAIPEPKPGFTCDLMRIQLGSYCQFFDSNEFVESCGELRELGVISGEGTSTSIIRAFGNTDVDAIFGLATERHEAGKLALADQLYRFVIERDPKHADATYRSGMIASRMGNPSRAIDLFYRALVADPKRVEFYVSLAILLGELGRAGDALELLDDAAALKSRVHEVLNARGVVLRGMGRNAEARAVWLEALAIEPDFVEPMRWLGGLLLDEKKPKEAIEHLETAYRIAPAHIEIQRCLGNALVGVSEPDRGAGLLAQAAASQPLRWELQNELGLALQASGNLEDAIVFFRRAIALKHDAGQARFNLSLALLAQGDYDAGWPEYEWRRSLEDDQPLHRRFVQPEWNGVSLAGRRLLVVSEQGLGDTIQFVRFLTPLKAMRARITLECQPPLVSLLSQLPAIERVLAQGEPLPDFDTHVRLTSVPGILGTQVDDLPLEIPYLRAEKSRIEIWKSKLRDGFNVGISWRGSPSHLFDRMRSIPLREFEPLSRIPNVNLVSLQQMAGSEELDDVAFPVQSFQEFSRKGGFLDSAGILQNLDLLISCDTSLVHLAGAMGVKTWVALPFFPDWRWMLNRDDSPWYPATRLFRQARPGAWRHVFEEISHALLAETRQVYWKKSQRVGT